MTSPKAAGHAFAKNRAEELGFDLWGEFVVPLYFERLALDEVRKPLVFEGGRGCGKTTLLRYLSHATQFSERRKLTPADMPSQIGLYLRADTQYLRTFRGDVLSDDGWQKAFEHELCLTIATEIFRALGALNTGVQRQKDFPGIATLDLSVWRDFDPEATPTFAGVAARLRSLKNQFAMWFNSPEDMPKPVFLPMKRVLDELISSIQAQLRFLANVVFFVFIDEYENLLEYQMRVINTRLKHSEAPLIFHVATKRNGMATRRTVGSEPLQERDDFRIFDVEEQSAVDYQLFAAELFCFRLRKKGIAIGPPEIGEDLLCSVTALAKRRTDETYRKETIEAARQALPGLSYLEAAAYVLDDKTLRGRLRDQLSAALRETDTSLDAEQFIRDEAPIESICAPALIYQGKAPKVVLGELDLAVQGKASKFKSSDWSHHYFAGCMFHLFLPLQRPCVLYAGFDAFLKLSRNNARHFLELCHLSMLDAVFDNDCVQPIEIEAQAYAARAASSLFVKETQGSGDFGNRLFLVVNTLGQIFRLSQARPSQSEAERTHFSVGRGVVDADSTEILAECVKWSVLFVAPETKVKDVRLESNEYIFNPIYAPYFGISTSKGRRLELKPETVKSLLTGTRVEMNALVVDYQKAWKLSELDQMPLFPPAH